MNKVVISGAVRTPVGSFGGSLQEVGVVDLGSIVMKEALERSQVRAEWVDEVIFGCVLQGGQGQNVARQSAVKAGIPVEVPAMTINKVCGSGLRAVSLGAQIIKAGDGEIVLAGGMENMSRAPYVLDKARFGYRMFDAALVDMMVKDGLWDAFNDYHMGITAENVAEKWGITREEQDAIGLRSQKLALKAINEGKFNEEIVPVEVKTKKKTFVFDTDEHPRETSLEKLAALKPAFKADGTVTAGNASGINDGAAAMVVLSEQRARELGIKPMASIVSYASAGVDPSIMGVGPIPATQKALKRAGLTIDDIDLIEANEAFAAQFLAVGKELGLSLDRVNVNGGAIALGHPIGASGARILVTLLHEMKRRQVRYGLATLCIGGGQGVAMVVERV